MKKHDIYLVEDNRDFRNLVRTIFQKFLPDYSVKCFQGGQELFQYMVLQSADEFAGSRPALIIMDLDLPAFNGREMLKLLRKTPGNEFTEWKDLPVVILSNSENQEDINGCYHAGASSYFVKPVEFEELRELLVMICHYWVDFNHLSLPTKPTANFAH